MVLFLIRLGASLAESPLVKQSTGKRKLEESDADDPHNKIRRIVRDHVSQDPARVMPMTTVICLHAAVAQKSYGSEKRFLCPPPVVHIEGPLWHMRSQQLSMAVVSEAGERSFEQKAPLDNNMTASFKFLHVTGTAKAKSFQLSLDIAEPPASSLAPESGETSSGRVWATFDSAPVTIISKPSKKTAKTRNISSCILAGGPVSLFNRINSQTVRTKYMTIDHAQLCASNVAWSAFNVNVVRRPGAEAPTVGACHVMRIFDFPALTLYTQLGVRSQSPMAAKSSFRTPTRESRRPL
jgi:recombining binding protein (suppressor of hairless)